MDGAIFAGHNVPTRLRLPGDAFDLSPCEHTRRRSQDILFSLTHAAPVRSLSASITICRISRSRLVGILDSIDTVLLTVASQRRCDSVQARRAFTDDRSGRAHFHWHTTCSSACHLD
jgi:hypothetical protein